MPKKYFLAGIIFVLICGGVLYSAWKQEESSEKQTVVTSPRDLSYKEVSVVIAGNTLTAFVSDTGELRSRGLSGFSKLHDDEAMLFIFENEGMWDFWMKDMKFSIDMVWVDKNKSVVGIEKAVSLETFPKSFSAGEKSLYVLEFNSGTVDQLGVKIGDEIILK